MPEYWNAEGVVDVDNVVDREVVLQGLLSAQRNAGGAGVKSTLGGRDTVGDWRSGRVRRVSLAV